MNDQLQQALANVIGIATDSVQEGVSFLQAQLPDVIQQLLVWKLAGAVLSVVVWALVLVASAIVVPKCIRVLREYGRAESQYQRNNGNDAERQAKLQMDELWPSLWLAIPGVVVSFVCTIVALVSLPSNAALALQIWLAPKIYLIEYAARLAK